MERLTLEQAISHCIERSDCTECGKQHKQLAEWLEELKHYKELKAQDRLIELPCKVGDKVYSVHSAGLSHAVITEVYTDAFCLMLCVAEGRFGKTVFLTKEEAEAKLAEM